MGKNTVVLFDDGKPPVAPHKPVGTKWQPAKQPHGKYWLVTLKDNNGNFLAQGKNDIVVTDKSAKTAQWQLVTKAGAPIEVTAPSVTFEGVHLKLDRPTGNTWLQVDSDTVDYMNGDQLKLVGAEAPENLKQIFNLHCEKLQCVIHVIDNKKNRFFVNTYT